MFEYEHHFIEYEHDVGQKKCEDEIGGFYGSGVAPIVMLSVVVLSTTCGALKISCISLVDRK